MTDLLKRATVERASITPEEVDAWIARASKDGEHPATRLIPKSSGRSVERFSASQVLREAMDEVMRVRPGSRWHVVDDAILELEGDRHQLRDALVKVVDHFAASQRGVLEYEALVHRAPAAVAKSPRIAFVVRATDRRGVVSSMVPAFQENRAASLLAVSRAVGVLHEHGGEARVLPRDGVLVVVLPVHAP